jgi:hypothetical protein
MAVQGVVRGGVMTAWRIFGCDSCLVRQSAKDG